MAQTKINDDQIKGTNWTDLTDSGVTTLHMHNPPACKATLAGNQTIGNGTVDLINWTAEEYDTDTMHDNSVNNSRVTCKTAGKYLILLTTIWASNNTGIRQLLLYKNGNYLVDVIAPNNNAGEDHNQCVTVADLVVNDYIEAKVYQGSGSTLALQVALGATCLVVAKL